MTADDITQIIVAGQRTGIVGLKKTLEEVAGECAGRPDAEITDELMARLSKKNYIVPKVKDAYMTAFLREYKKFVGEPFEETVDPDLVQIKVLGPGCPNCERLEQDLMALMAELQIKADLEHVRDPVEIGTLRCDGHAGPGDQRQGKGRRQRTVKGNHQGMAVGSYKGLR